MCSAHARFWRAVRCYSSRLRAWLRSFTHPRDVGARDRALTRLWPTPEILLAVRFHVAWQRIFTHSRGVRLASSFCRRCTLLGQVCCLAGSGFAGARVSFRTFLSQLLLVCVVRMRPFWIHVQFFLTVRVVHFLGGAFFPPGGAFFGWFSECLCCISSFFVSALVFP